MKSNKFAFLVLFFSFITSQVSCENPKSSLTDESSAADSTEVKKQDSIVNTVEQDGPIVDTSKQIYSYTEMMEDIQQLVRRYPECVKYKEGEKTCQGRVIPIVYFGNQNANSYVMIQATMHAREYMSTLVVMALLEHYASQYLGGERNGSKIKDLFQKVCLVILPMVNPDGVEIAQKGEAGAVTDDVKQWVRSNVKAGTPYDQIKSNAQGVDLNRNFRSGFGKDRQRKPSKNFSHYPGPKPYSEIETNFLMELARRHNYICFLNYHTKGNLIYYGCGSASAAVNKKALTMANIIKQNTGFTPHGPSSSPAIGSWADEVEMVLNRPSATIELGTQNPVPIREFSTLFSKNKWVWADLAKAIINGNI